MPRSRRSSRPAPSGPSPRWPSPACWPRPGPGPTWSARWRARPGPRAGAPPRQAVRGRLAAGPAARLLGGGRGDRGRARRSPASGPASWSPPAARARPATRSSRRCPGCCARPSRPACPRPTRRSPPWRRSRCTACGWPRSGPGAKVVVIGLGPGRPAGRAAGHGGGLRRGRHRPGRRTRASAAAGSGVLALDELGDATTGRVLAWSRGRGADAVLVCAASRSSDPVTAGARAVPGPGAGRHRRRRRPGPGPHAVLREGAVAAVRALLRAGPVRPVLRGLGRGLPGRAGALDRGPQLRGGARPAGRGPAAGRRPGHAHLRHRRRGRRRTG